MMKFCWALMLLHLVACSKLQPTADAGTETDAGTIACEHWFRADAPAGTEDLGLRINEVLTSNDGAAVDELGETDDYIELINTSASAIDLAGLVVADSSHRVELPSHAIAPGQRVLLWADDDVEQGPLHLPFKLDRQGEWISLWRNGCTQLDALQVPELAVDEVFARFPDGTDDTSKCRYASPGRSNRDACDPAPPLGLDDAVSFAPYTWPKPWPTSTAALVISEFALAPSGFVEISNASTAEVALAGLSLRLAAQGPGAAWPDASVGMEISLPATSVAAGARISVPLPSATLESVLSTPAREGVITLFGADKAVLDRLDFMSLPDGSALAREVPGPRLYRLCANPSPGVASACEAMPERPIGDRLRALNAAGDFDALAKGGTEVGTSAVKFVVDMQAGDVVHLLSSERWALHYNFIREQIDGEPALDRCNASESALFQQGWYEFSVREYFRVEGRRYLLGTLVQNANGLATIEFAVGDAIVAEQMRRAFFAVVAHTADPSRWALRPQDALQLAEMRKLDGELPIVGTNAPFRDLSYQPLTRAVGYGTLRFVSATELSRAALGPQVIAITDDVPNDIPLVGGLITEAFQTPLAHVNVLSEARGTPNMGLRNARTNPRLSPLLGKLVRLEAGASDFQVREASAEEAAAFYASREPQGPRRVPFHDESVRGIQPLAQLDIAAAVSVGSKAAQLAELAKVNIAARGCPAATVPLSLPQKPIAIPFAHYSDHFAQSGAEQRLTQLLADAGFRANPEQRAKGLAELRSLITTHPVDSTLLDALRTDLTARFGKIDLRFRSSSNVEDLDTFNGAGLHNSSDASLSESADVNIEDALRTVWASLWNERAYDERELAHLEQSAARMGVLVHEAFAGEAAQGVAISRNLFDIARSDIYYINAQRGEASVTNPAPGVVTEQLLYTWPPRSPAITYQSASSLNDNQPVLTPDEVRSLACALAAIHAHFRPLLDPLEKNRTFAMQIEWKLTHTTRALLIKQARPQPFGHAEVPSDCRDF